MWIESGMWNQVDRQRAEFMKQEIGNKEKELLDVITHNRFKLSRFFSPRFFFSLSTIKFKKKDN